MWKFSNCPPGLAKRTGRKGRKDLGEKLLWRVKDQRPDENKYWHGPLPPQGPVSQYALRLAWVGYQRPQLRYNHSKE